MWRPTFSVSEGGEGCRAWAAPPWPRNQALPSTPRAVPAAALASKEHALLGQGYRRASTRARASPGPRTGASGGRRLRKGSTPVSDLRPCQACCIPVVSRSGRPGRIAEDRRHKSRANRRQLYTPARCAARRGHHHRRTKEFSLASRTGKAVREISSSAMKGQNDRRRRAPGSCEPSTI